MKLLLAILLVASTSYGQVLRPPNECTDTQLYYCEIFNIEPCICNNDPPRRIAPTAPPVQHGVDYSLDKTIGLTALDYKDPNFPGWPETVAQIRSLGFTSSQLWVDYTDVYCRGRWMPPFPSNQWETYDRNCVAAEMIKYGGSTQLFLRMDDPLQAYFLINRWYELAWFRDVTIVLTRWEQDNYLAQDEITEEEYMERWYRLKAEEEFIQQSVELARASMMRRYPYARIQILNSMVVNRFPGINVKPWQVGWPTVTDMIAKMEHKPDLIGVSYWKRGMDPTVALDWIIDTTGYTKSRLYIAEFGARQNEQPERYYDYIRIFWSWGIDTVLVWAWRSPWDDELYTPTAEGMRALQELNHEAVVGE